MWTRLKNSAVTWLSFNQLSFVKTTARQFDTEGMFRQPNNLLTLCKTMFELKNVVELKELFIAKKLHNLHNQQKEVP